MSTFELTRFVKDAGPLTKHIYLDNHSKVLSDGSPCMMSSGTAH
jgi:hypothetical protein